MDRKGPGRPAGSLNKENRALREMILAALDAKGGIDYLAKQADEHPAAFMSLLAKVLPMAVQGSEEDGSHKLVLEWRKS